LCPGGGQCVPRGLQVGGGDRGLLLERGFGGNLGRDLGVDVVVILQVEQTLTNMAADVGFVAVEAEALAAAFKLLHR
jgi:hypothetical protein